MPTFETPNPVHVQLELLVANVTIAAEDRATTEVTISPVNPDDKSDVEAVEQSHVELSKGTVTVKGPKFYKYIGPNSKSRAVKVSIVLPTGSSVSGSGFGSMLTLNATGRLGACDFRSGMGNIFVEHAGPVKLRTTGNIVVDRASGDLDAVTAGGSIRIGEVREGTVNLKSAMGEIEVGIAEGTSAWLDFQTGIGTIRKQLDDTGQPGSGDSTVTVRARTAAGDILIHRAQGS